MRPTRHADPLSPSQRKNQELLETATAQSRSPAGWRPKKRWKVTMRKDGDEIFLYPAGRCESEAKKDALDKMDDWEIVNIEIAMHDNHPWPWGA